MTRDCWGDDDGEQDVEHQQAPTDSEQRCAWSEAASDEDYETARCATGKPPLFFNCNEPGPVCEDHVCRCRPSLLTERAMGARHGTGHEAERAVWAAAYGTAFAGLVLEKRRGLHPSVALEHDASMAGTYAWRIADAAVVEMRKGQP